ncbi:NAD(P)H-binding protein [Vibrio hippocampi]|uniref:NAD(P)-binding domain-containing protein n=1 Tax=Vibrio hippocampi TaxID=654686 RepID=A0ABN8DHU6_9VIBR|nr:NAD(P)H-binding protein [Vibrio hippocampi]CAH0526126.1 hypothetical protein VHP8226_01600 [Vibrio hippocampi]
MKHKAIIAGATGLVGRHLLQQLDEANNVERLFILSRRAIEGTVKGEQLVTNDLSVPDHDKTNMTADIGFICLGTTLKQAGSKQALREIDCDLVVKVAKSMREVGVSKVVVVSSLGASVNALSHYLKTKGEMELQLAELGFRQVIFARPGPLAGRQENIRADEVLVQRLLGFITPLLIGPLRNFKPIEAKDVASAMFILATSNLIADHVAQINSAQLSQISRRASLKESSIKR